MLRPLVCPVELGKQAGKDTLHDPTFGPVSPFRSELDGGIAPVLSVIVHALFAEASPLETLLLVQHG